MKKYGETYCMKNNGAYMHHRMNASTSSNDAECIAHA